MDTLRHVRLLPLNDPLGRLTMDCILAERFQKFVHIENFANSIYKSFKFIIGTYNDDDTLPGNKIKHKEC